jgi:hypothetical protein
MTIEISLKRPVRGGGMHARGPSNRTLGRNSFGDAVVKVSGIDSTRFVACRQR